jgi:hypothetical protein
MSEQTNLNFQPIKWRPREQGLNLQASSLEVAEQPTEVSLQIKAFALCSQRGDGAWEDKTYYETPPAIGMMPKRVSGVWVWVQEQPDERDAFDVIYKQATAALLPYQRAILAQMEALESDYDNIAEELTEGLLATLEKDRRELTNFAEALPTALREILAVPEDGQMRSSERVKRYCQALVNLALRIEKRSMILIARPEWKEGK